MKKPTIIAADMVPRTFSDDRIRRMVSAAKLKNPAAELKRFAEAVREAVLGLLEDRGKPTANQVHHEIAELVRAAVRATKARKRPDYWYEQVASLVERLAAGARKIMNRRGTLPDPATLRDPTRQRDACHVILGLGRLGVRHEPGRKRGEEEETRSVTEASEVYAPPLDNNPLRNEPLIVFVERLENAHLRATGGLPPFTANFYHPGPFAKFLQACLDAAKAGANAIELLEARRRRRQIKERHQKRLNHLTERWDRAMRDQILRWSRRRILDVVRHLSGRNP